MGIEAADGIASSRRVQDTLEWEEIERRAERIKK